MKKLLYVANWKMNVTPEQTSAFYHDNYDELYELSDNADIVLCPSFVSLGLLSPFLRNTEISLGAQNCSEHISGAFTGEVDATSLEQLGCSFCIIGHSERRTLFNETNEVIASKMQRLLEQQITPIICVGETDEQRKQQKTQEVVASQLHSILSLLKAYNNAIVIAYEPVWAIGTGNIPTIEELNSMFNWLKQHVTNQVPHISVRYLYGGSIQPTNIKKLKDISILDGFLIGNASSDFQTFKNIVI